MKGFRRLAVLGGSSPYTIGLVDCLGASREVGTGGEVILAGRDLLMLQLMQQYAAHSLRGRWRVRIALTPEDALDGSDVVLHQIRYGGLAAREDDERLARRFAAPADESLGPAGLVAGIRMAPPRGDDRPVLPGGRGGEHHQPVEYFDRAPVRARCAPLYRNV
jgi:6-phospho-beta-glucosidase